MNVPLHIIKFFRKYNNLVSFQDGFISATNNYGVIATYQCEYERDGVYRINSNYELTEVTTNMIEYLDQPIRLLANSKRAGIDVSRFMRVKNFTNTYYQIGIANLNFVMYKLAFDRALSISQWNLKRNIYYTPEYLIVSFLDGKLKIFLPIDYTYFS